MNKKPQTQTQTQSQPTITETRDDKSLSDKAITFMGKRYVLVQDRILYFNEHCPQGMIKTKRLTTDDKQEIFEAVVMPDTLNPQRFFTGHSQAIVGQGMVNKTAALENAETSAVGRALAMMGIGVIDGVASADEMKKAGAFETRPAYTDDAGLIREPTEDATEREMREAADEALPKIEAVMCETCGLSATERQGINKIGKPYHGVFCSSGDKSHTRWIHN